MKIKCGIIGLPNVGKSTLFKVLTNISVKIANFPFCTISPNISVIEVPDERLNQLNNIIQSKEIIHAKIKFIDFAGLIKGVSKSDGLSIQILRYLQTTHMFCHVVRCFYNDTILHIENTINPYRDINLINTELLLFDIDQCEKNILYLKKQYHRIIDKNINIDHKLFILEKCLIFLNDGYCLRDIKCPQIKIKDIQNFNFLTAKPMIYIANINNQKKNNFNLEKINIFLGLNEKVSIISDCLLNYDTLSSSNQSKSIILRKIINNIFSVLYLNTFFTVNKNMIRAWISTHKTTAFDAAAFVHSDFKRGFIRTQIIKYNDFIDYQGEIGSKKVGKVRYEGKHYNVQDGDILKFLFHV